MLETLNDERLEEAVLLGSLDDIRSLVKSNLQWIDEHKKLPVELLDALRKAGVLRMSMPKAYGGLELDPIRQVKLVQVLSGEDASVGWCVAISSEGGYYASLIPELTARRLYYDPNLITAGTIAPAGRARKVDGGYEVIGKWSFASFSQNADLIYGGCVVYENNQPKLKSDGAPLQLACFFKPDECDFVDTWNTSGLKGTSSQTFIVKKVFVAEDAVFNLSDSEIHRPEPLYRLRCMSLVKMIGIPLGVAQSALIAFTDWVKVKKVLPEGHFMSDELTILSLIGRHQAEFEAVECHVYATLKTLWDGALSGVDPEPIDYIRFRGACVHAAKVCKSIILSLYSHSRSSVVYTSHPLERKLRDMLVACQHVTFSDYFYKTSGQVYLGQEVDDKLCQGLPQ